MIKKQNVNREPFWNNIKVVPYLYILPNMILFFIFMIIPLFVTGYYSLVKWNGMGKPKFIFLDNYIKLLSDRIFRESLVTTFKFTIIVVPLLMVFALLFAIFLNQRFKFRGIVRSALYVPSVISMVAVGMVFTWLFDPKIGLINYVLETFSLTKIDWYNDPKYALIMIIAGTLWSKIGYNMVIYLAGIQGISNEYYEAATMDGAGTLQKFFYITFPLLRTTHIFIMITSVIYTFKTFDLIYVMTKGGPLNSTKTLVVYIYETAFIKNQFGLASAGGVILFLILAVITILQFRGEKED